MMLEARQPDLANDGARAREPGLLVDALDLERERDVRQHIAPREQRIVLRQVARARVGLEKLTAVVAHDAGVRLREPGREIEQGRLPAARWPDQRDEAAALDPQVDPLKNRDIPEAMAHHLERQHRAAAVRGGRLLRRVRPLSHRTVLRQAHLSGRCARARA